MKERITRKTLVYRYRCVSVHYANLQHLLSYQGADYYTCGTYGWNFDAYVFGNYCITTGYRGTINNCGKYSSYELEREYDEKARKLIEGLHDFSEESYRKHVDEVNGLLKEYLVKVFEDETITVLSNGRWI